MERPEFMINFYYDYLLLYISMYKEKNESIIFVDSRQVFTSHVFIHIYWTQIKFCAEFCRTITSIT